MTSRDYTKEIGLRNDAAKLPLPYAIALIAVVLAAGGFGIAAIHQNDAKEPEVKAKDAKTVVTAAHTSAGGR